MDNEGRFRLFGTKGTVAEPGTESKELLEIYNSRVREIEEYLKKEQNNGSQKRNS